MHILPTTWDILGLGCVAVDDLLHIDNFPPPDTKIPIQARQRQCGGQTANALMAAARLGARCAFAGTLGNDETSRFVMDALEREGIDLAPLRRLDDARPIQSTILVDRSAATRTVLYDLSGTVPASPDWPPEEAISKSRLLFVDHYGVEGMLRAARIARNRGLVVVADFDFDDWPGFDALFELVDHLIIDDALARKRTGHENPADAVKALWNGQRQAVVVTCGAAGCWWLGRSHEKPLHQPAFAVNAVDTTGCGDVFHGAYMAALVRDLALAECVRVASAAAAIKAAQPGGQWGSPRWEEVQDFLANRPGADSSRLPA